MHIWSCTKLFPHGKNKVDLNTWSFSEESSCNTHWCSCTSLRFLMLDGNCWALRHGQAFLPVSRKQNLVHVHTEMLSCPARTDGHLNVSFFNFMENKAHIHDGGRKNCNFTLCKTSRIGTFHKVVHDVSSFAKQKTKIIR